MRILFITANRIGDAVLSSGVLAWLEEAYPMARFTVVCGPVAADLFRAVPRLERLIVLRKQKRHGHWLGLWRTCVGTRWDVVVDFRNSIVSRFLFAKKRAYRPARSTGRHKVEDYAAAFALNPPPAPRLWLDAKAAREAAGFLEGAGPILALAPAANWAPKQWPVEKFTQLALRLTAAGGPMPRARVLVVAAPHERAQIAPLLEALPKEKLIDITGCDLLTAAACLKKCRLFVGNDSSLMHIAAAVGAPTLGLFGPGYEKMFGPWGNKTAFVRTPESAAVLLERLVSPNAVSPNLMESLSVEIVYDAARALVEWTETSFE